MKKICLVVILLFPALSFSQIPDQRIDVHFYPHSLCQKDYLQDGPYGKYLDIQDDTFLVWVDLFPGMFFAHDTAYLFISEGNIRIETGYWWPVLNGKTILYNENEKYALVSPFELRRVSDYELIDAKIDIHIYPHELTSQDMLTDGPTERLFNLDDTCLLIWIDLLPDAYFVHPTAYIFISKNDIRIEYGDWWPELNGKRILYGQQNKTGIISPFIVTSIYY
jgi:hypothetical protein